MHSSSGRLCFVIVALVIEYGVISSGDNQRWPRLPPRSILVLSSDYHILFNDSVVNNCIIFLRLNSADQIYTIAKSVDSDGTARKDLHCLPFGFWDLNDTPLTIMGISKFKDGRIRFRNSNIKWLYQHNDWPYLYE